MNKIIVQQDWTLFLDRDGVINRRIPGEYIQSVSDFEFLPGVLESIAFFSKIFCHLIVVTNQQGIGKGLMTEAELQSLHDYMLKEIRKAKGCIDGIYFCGEQANQPGNCRKPAPVMAYRALQDFPDIDFKKSIMVGDSITDVGFGHGLEMKTILVGEQLGYPHPKMTFKPDYIAEDLLSVRNLLCFEQE